ncbi:MAG: hypothetical protein WCB50_21935, partial [Pseudolabrys sp.]
LGQKRTFAVQYAMSALPPKADIAPLPDSGYFLCASYSLFSSRESSIRKSDRARPPENSAACLD